MSCKCKMGALGIAPVVVAAIISAIVSGVSMGLSYWSAVKAAKEQLKIQEALQEDQIEAIATAMANQYPVLGYSDWYYLIDYEFRTGYVPPSNIPPANGDQTNNGTTPKTDYTSYLWIGAFAILAFALVRGK